MKNVALHNLGCKVNSYEIEVMQQKLQEKGYNIVPFDEIADIYIVNTCTVTNIADRKSRQMLHRARQLNPNAVVVAVGCYVQTGRETLEKDDSIDLAIGNNRKKDIVTILEEYLKEREEKSSREPAGDLGECREGEPASEKVDKTLRGTTVPDINHTYEYEEMQLRQTAEHTRAYIKIQDGCNQFCSYCAIPYARGRVRSRRAEDVLAEVRAMAEKGYQEIVLTGIHISSYGIDFDGEQWKQGKSVESRKGERPEYSGESRLIDLVEKLHEIDGIRRIRLGSLEPRIVTEQTAERLAAMPKVCPHFHLSLQSGCDETLRRMNRHYTTGEYYTCVEYLRRAFRNPAITTDVIVGFPGETEEEFEQTRRFLEKVHFYEMHVFKYSKRTGTVAAGMPGQVPEPVKTARSNELLELERRQSKEFRTTYIGQVAEVLLEENKNINGAAWLVGHTEDYVKVALKAEDDMGRCRLNTMVKVKVSAFLTDEILAGDPVL
ncbi:MAG: MiaB/RimO family radical SAM methylthiotransferase [Acetatifactor sp.]